MNRGLVLTALLACVPLAGAQVTPARANALQQNETALQDLIERALGGVVYINVTTPLSGQGPAANPLFRSPEGDTTGGSGFFVNDQGYVLTNYHVVEGASKLTVNLLGSREEYPAQLVGTAPDHDLALLQVQNLPRGASKPLPLGDSDTLRPGQLTIALGAPFGLQFSASTGIVSAVERTVPTGQRMVAQNAIQTDAAINPGNSGGPLLNSRGQVIGINTMIFSPVGGLSGIGQNAGVGFAIPVNTARRILSRMQSGETVTGPVLGVTLAPFELSDFTEQARQQYRIPRRGAMIMRIEPGSGAARAGLRGGDRQVSSPFGPILLGGDVITSVDGRAVESSADLREYLFARRVGDVVTLHVQRDGKQLTVPVTLGAQGR